MKIEVYNSTTGEITQVEADATLGQIVGVSNMNESEMSEAIAADIKGLSPAKVSEVLKMIIDTEKPFFNAIDAIRNGDTKRFRLVIEDATSPAGQSTKPEGELITQTKPKEPEAPQEDAEEGDGDHYDAVYVQAKAIVEKDDRITKADLKNKLGVDADVFGVIWAELESDGMFDNARAEDQAAKEEASKEAEDKAAGEAEGEPVKEEAESQGASTEDENQAEAPNPEYADDPEEAANVRGQKAYLRGDGPDDNPFDGGTDDAIEWKKNYDHAAKSMKALFDEGKAAADEGKALADCPYEVGSVKFAGWKNGFDSVEQTEAPKSNDSHAEGKQAALNGGSIEDNPHAAGMTKHRIWNEGFSEGQAELA